jgi:hypothetical protein
MSDRDYYELLGLTPRADGAMVDQAYWHLARKYQMLAVTNPRARSMLDELNEAYGVLGNPRLREQYDAFRDDVLIRKGMIRPVASHPKTAPAAPRPLEPAPDSDKRATRRIPRPRFAIALPRLGRDEWRSLGVGAIIFTLALAGAWQGVNVVLVVAALVFGLAMALTPVLRRQLADVSLSLPAVTMPHIEMPKLPDIAVPRLRDVVAVPKDEPAGPDELRQSTAAMITRWRNTVGLVADPQRDSSHERPSRRLVEIVETERKLDESDEPLAAVMDILRRSGAHSTRTNDGT